MTRSTKVFLVLLRLAIGWHFLFEGLEKLNSYEKTAKPAWSSENYFRESAAPGPLGKFFRWLPGDEVLDRCTMAPLPEGADPSATPEYKKLPPALEKDWRGFYDRFVAYYGLDEQQKKVTEAILKQHQEQTALWLRGQGDHGTVKVTRTPPAGNGTIEVTMPVPERIQEYRQKIEQLQQLEATEGAVFGTGAKKKIDSTKAEVRKIRGELEKELVKQTAAMAAGLRRILTHGLDDEVALLAGGPMFAGAQGMFPKEQLDKQPELEPLMVSRDRVAGLTEPERLVVADRYQPVGRGIGDYDRLDWMDFLSRWGLVVMGGLLLLGLFTRSACVAGAIFLLTLYLAMPPWPGAPELARMEGRFIINKNLIETLALLTLATTASGRWLGLDGLLQYFHPRRWRRAPAAPRRISRAPVNTSSPSYVKEAAHGH